jgi:hypothetical protein
MSRVKSCGRNSFVEVIDFLGAKIREETLDRIPIQKDLSIEG